VRHAPGIPCALFSLRDNDDATLGRKSRRGNAACRLLDVIAREKRAIQYSRGFSVEHCCLEYWVVRSSRTTTAEQAV
jgi:hypothetical protein